MKLEDATFTEFVTTNEPPQVKPPGQADTLGRIPITLDMRILPDEGDDDESLAEALNQELEIDLGRAVGLLSGCRDIFDRLLGSKRLLDRLGHHRIQEMKDCATDVAAFLEEWSFIDAKD